MKFGAVPAREAEGAILAHSLGLPDGKLRKGRVLTAEDVARLAEAGIASVTVARAEPGDLTEDAAAARLARALVPDPEAAGLRVAAPGTGRANIHAEIDGVLTVNAEAVAAFNGIDEALTLATLAHHARVAGGQMVATLKIIPYGAPETAVRAAETVLRRGDVLRVHPVVARSALVVLTRVRGLKPALIAKGSEAVRARLAALGIDRVDEAVVDHDTGPIAGALAESDADIVLILTGSATSDRRDVAPAGLVRAGGELVRFGMPVDPGNLTFLGRLDGRPVIGLPGTARSPKLSGSDWILERLACGLDVTSADIAAMGVGGLLKEIPSRPAPRRGGAEAPRRPVIGAVLLAAGGSTRMRGADKLMEEVQGMPLIRRVAREVGAAGVDEVRVVLRPDDEARAEALSGLDLSITRNPRAADGMATSIAAGVAALDPACDAALIVMADMPEIRSGDIDRMIARFDPGENRAIVRAAAPGGRPGHPVLFGRRFFEALERLEGDRGAREVVDEHPEFVVDVVIDGERAVTDLDTPEAWAAWRAR